MPLVNTEAIVLKTYKLQEADKIVVMFTRRTGLLRTIAKGARRLKSRFGASLEPLTVSNVSYYEKEGRELFVLHQAEVSHSCFSVAADENVIEALGHMSNLVMEFAPLHEPNENLFKMLKACAETVAADPESAVVLQRYFELWLLRLSGFLPDLLRCGVCNSSIDEETKTLRMGKDGSPRCEKCKSKGKETLSWGAYCELRAMQTSAPAVWARRAKAFQQSVQSELTQFLGQLIGEALDHHQLRPLSLKVQF